MFGFISSIFMLLLVLWVNFHHNNHKYSVKKLHHKKAINHLSHTIHHSNHSIKHTHRRSFSGNKQGRTTIRKYNVDSTFSEYFGSTLLFKRIYHSQYYDFNFSELLHIIYLHLLCRWNL